MTMAHETILFSFPSVSLAPPHSPSSIGLLVLSSSQQPTPFDPSRHDVFLRVQHTPDSLKTSHPTDVLIEAWRTLRKVSPREFVLASEFGELVITFPELHHLLPQNDARIEIPREVRCTMTWEAIVRSFETEIDRFVTYEKNEYSLLDEPFSQKGVPKYDPSVYGRPEDEKQQGGRVILVDEENGDEVGEVGGLNVSSIGVVPGSKDPVEITFPTEGETGPVTVRPAHPEYLRDAYHPAYASSTLVQTAATASRLIVTTSSYLSSALTSGARTFTEKTRPNAVPTTFQPSTHTRFQKVHTITAAAAKFSSATVGKVGQLAQNAGAKLAGKDGERERGAPRNPNILNKSLIAFETVAEGIDEASRNLMQSGTQAAATVVGHRYGDEAGQVARNLVGSARNVGLVYIDASGVSRRAVVKGVAKGMVVGKVKGGGEVIVPPATEEGLPPPGYTQAYVTGTPTTSPPAASPGGSNSLYFSPPPGGRSPPRAEEKGKGAFRF